MSLLVRKIVRTRWSLEQQECYKYCADAITGDLRTVKNTISLWEIDSMDNFNEAVLALATNCNSISSMDFVILDFDELNKKEILLKNNKGKTAYEIYDDKHYDVIDVSYESLGVIAEYIQERIVTNNFKRLTTSQVKKLLIDGVINNKVNIDKLDERLRNKIGV